MEAAPLGAINLGFGEPTFDTPKAILQAAHRAVDAGRLGYTPTAGIPELRQAIADYSGSELGADSVLVTVGTQEALFATMLAWLDLGDEVLVPDPGFPAYPAIARLAGARPVSYPLSASEGFRFHTESLESRITPRTRALILNSPANPTGGIISREELRKVAELAREQQLLVISDEVYREIYFADRPPSYLDVSSDGVVVSSLSKSAHRAHPRGASVCGHVCAYSFSKSGPRGIRIRRHASSGDLSRRASKAERSPRRARGEAPRAPLPYSRGDFLHVDRSRSSGR
jgi:aspartate/methionine/tyrosine aminotransferase